MLLKRIGKKCTMAFLLALTLSGCSTPQNASTAATAATESAATKEPASEYAQPEQEKAAAYITDGDYNEVQVGICVLDDTDTALTDQIINFLEEKDIPEENISLNRDASSSSEAVANAKSMLSSDSIDILFADAGSREAVEQITDAASMRGRAVIFIGTAPSSDETDRWSRTDMIRAFYAGADTSQTAARQGDVLTSINTEDLDTNNNDKIGTLVIDSDQDVLTQKMKNADRSLDVLDSEDAGLRADTASQKVKDALDKYEDDLEVIVCGSDAEALSAIQAVQDADKTPGKDVFVIGAGATDDGLNAVSGGTLAGTVYGDTYEQAKAASDAAFGFLSGSGKSGTFLSDEIAVTGANVQEIIDYKG